MRFIRNLSFLILAIFLLTTGLAFADSSENNGMSVFFELGGANDPDAIGGTFGVTSDVSDYFSYNGGLTYFASEHSSDVFGGVSLGIRTRTSKYPVMPFIGVGIFSGISKANVPADDDGEDNDGDGVTDEDGEEEEVIDDVLCSIYPEAGLSIRFSDEVGLILSAKRHFTTEGSDYRFSMYSAAFSIYF